MACFSTDLVRGCARIRAAASTVRLLALVIKRMTREDPVNFQWLEPWHFSELSGVAAELKKEIGPGHPLFGHDAKAIGRKDDRDDVWFRIPSEPSKFAVLHLTWSGTRELDPK